MPNEKNASVPNAALPPDIQRQALDGFRPDLEKRIGLQPFPSGGPGVWDHIAAGTKHALADFVARVFHGETHSPERDKDQDKGLDR
jgi:hypothetical protein